jgi:hypothetical protein
MTFERVAPARGGAPAGLLDDVDEHESEAAGMRSAATSAARP